MVSSQLYADMPDLTDTELRIILVVLGNPGVMTMNDVQQRTGRKRQVYEAIKSLEAKGWLVRTQAATIGAISWEWKCPRYDTPIIATSTAQMGMFTTVPTKKVAKPKNPPKPKNAAQEHPAVLAYVEIVRRRPTHAVAEQIASTITDIDRWRETVKQYVLRGWNPLNIVGMIQVYNGEIKLTTKKGKYSTEIPHQSPDVAKAAWEAYLEQEGETNDG